MFCCYLLKACSFLMKARKGEKLDGRGGLEELGAVEGMEAVFRLYCMTEESMVNWSGSRKDPYQKIPFNYTCIFTHSLHKFHPPFPFPLDNHILIAHPRSSTATKSIKFPHPSEILTFILVLSSTPKLFLSMDYSLLIIYLMANVHYMISEHKSYLSFWSGLPHSGLLFSIFTHFWQLSRCYFFLTAEWNSIVYMYHLVFILQMREI